MNRYIILLIIIVILIYKFSSPKKNLDCDVSSEIPNVDTNIYSESLENETPIEENNQPIEFELNNTNVFSEDESVPKTTSIDTDYVLNNTNVYNQENIDDDDFNIEEIMNNEINLDESQALPVYGIDLLNINGNKKESETKPDTIAGYDSSINFSELFYSEDISNNPNLTLNPQNDLIKEMEYYENLEDEIDITKNQEGYWESLDREKFTNRTDKNEQVCEINYYKNNNDKYVDMTVADVYDTLTGANINRTPLRHDDQTMMGDNVPDAIYGGSVENKLTLFQ